MTGLPVEAEYAHDPAGDVTSGDRDNLAARLNDAFAAGDLTMDDYQARLSVLFAASKRAELVPVLAGLPARYRTTAPTLGGDQPGQPGQVAPLHPAPRGLILAGAGAAAALVVLVVILAILL